MAQHQNTVEVYQHPEGTWDFRVIAAENGNILASSMQGYVDKAMAKRMALRVTNGTAANSFAYTPHEDA